MIKMKSSALSLAALFLVAACAGPQVSSGPSGVAVPVTDVKAVAGTWVGVASRASGRSDDWLELRLNEDGTFEGFSARQIGVLLGKGRLTVTGGKVMAVGAHGRALLTLYDRGGPLLVVDFAETDGVKYSAELRPKT